MDFTTTWSVKNTSNNGYPQLNWVLSSPYYRSKASGNWTDSTTWQQSPDNSAWENAAAAPDYSSLTITILNNHEITMNGNVTIDELTIANGGTLTVNQGQTLTLA